VIVLPPVLAFSRRDPADLGLQPDGEPPPSRGERGEALAYYDREIERSVHPDAAIRMRAFWLLAACFGLTMAGLSSVLLHQIPMLIDRGMPAAHASYVLGATAAMGVVGKLGFGALLERYDQRRVAAVCFALQGAGVALLLVPTLSAPLLACYVVLYGYAMGGNATLVASLTGEVFGRLHYGTISGRMTPFVVLSQAVGVPAVGYARDLGGSYVPPLCVIIVGALLASVLVLQVRYPGRSTRLAAAGTIA